MSILIGVPIDMISEKMKYVVQIGLDRSKLGLLGA